MGGPQCSSAASSCTACLPMHYFTNSQCTSCPRNCEKCSSSGCTACRRGFTLKTDGGCRGCSIYCSDCHPDNIMTCTKCSQGLELKNGQCTPCPEHCERCNSGSVVKCLRGYQPNSAKTACIPGCSLPCLTCQDGQPSVCTSCFEGATLSGSSCVLNDTCNTNNNCLHCPLGTNYVLVGANCIQCPAITNCIQCSQTNT